MPPARPLNPATARPPAPAAAPGCQVLRRAQGAIRELAAIEGPQQTRLMELKPQDRLLDIEPQSTSQDGIGDGGLQ
jgi:hypothetical protein